MRYVVQCTTAEKGDRWRFIAGSREEAEDVATRIRGTFSDVQTDIQEEKEKHDGKPNDDADSSTPTD